MSGVTKSLDILMQSQERDGPPRLDGAHAQEKDNSAHNVSSS